MIQDRENVEILGQNFNNEVTDEGCHNVLISCINENTQFNINEEGYVAL